MALRKKSSPINLGPKNLNTFWCTGWAWNCHIIFRCASIHGRASFILFVSFYSFLKYIYKLIMLYWFSTGHSDQCHWEIYRSNTRFTGRGLSDRCQFRPLTGWVWNCHIIFRCASIHGRASFILFVSFYLIKCINSTYVLINRAVVPYEISKVNFRVETKILDSMSEEI
jgi:hypothetical protein